MKKDNVIGLNNLMEGFYSVQVSSVGGLSLVSKNSFSVPNKIYGKLPEKVKEIWMRYEFSEETIGVFVSGGKGLGKSLFTKLLSNKASKKGVPVICVDKIYNGLDALLESLEQDAVIILDGIKIDQALIKLLNSEVSAKLLFVVTGEYDNSSCRLLTECKKRLRYHLTLGYPEIQEACEFLKDNIKEEFKEEILNVLKYSFLCNFSYGELHTIAFNVNLGFTFEEIFDDLNVNKSVKRMNAFIHFDGELAYVVEIPPQSIEDGYLKGMAFKSLGYFDTRYLVDKNSGIDVSLSVSGFKFSEDLEGLEKAIVPPQPFIKMDPLRNSHTIRILTSLHNLVIKCEGGQAIVS